MTLLFTDDHEWLQVDSDIAVIGITHFAQAQLGDIVFVELPEIGRILRKAEVAATVESVKAASDVYAPITGEVVEINDAIILDPALVNSDPGKAGWFFKLRISQKSELDGLMDEIAYSVHIS